jgi:hypothetical protein
MVLNPLLFFNFSFNNSNVHIVTTTTLVPSFKVNSKLALVSALGHGFIFLRKQLRCSEDHKEKEGLVLCHFIGFNLPGLTKLIVILN